MRFPAALLVVAFHGAPGILRNSIFLAAIFPFYTVVTLFFMLSGFVLTWVWQPHLGARVFLWRRFARIWPLHILCWGGIILVLVGMHHTGTIDMRGAVSGIFLTQAWTANVPSSFAVNAPAWSLSCEAAFYLIFPFMMRPAFRMWSVDPRKAVGLLFGYCLVFGLAVRGVLLLTSGAKAASFPGALLYPFPPYRVGEFLLGVMIARAMIGGWRSTTTLPRATFNVMIGLLVIGVLDTAIYRVSPPNVLPEDLGDLLLLLPLAQLVAAAASSDLRAHRVASRPQLGRLAFAIYISATLTAVIVQPWIRPRLAFMPGLAELACLELLVVAVALAAHTWVEVPMERWLRGMVRPPQVPGQQSPPKRSGRELVQASRT